MTFYTNTNAVAARFRMVCKENALVYFSRERNYQPSMNPSISNFGFRAESPLSPLPPPPPPKKKKKKNLPHGEPRDLVKFTLFNRVPLISKAGRADSLFNFCLNVESQFLSNEPTVYI